MSRLKILLSDLDDLLHENLRSMFLKGQFNIQNIDKIVDQEVSGVRKKIIEDKHDEIVVLIYDISEHLFADESGDDCYLEGYILELLFGKDDEIVSVNGFIFDDCGRDDIEFDKMVDSKKGLQMELRKAIKKAELHFVKTHEYEGDM